MGGHLKGCALYFNRYLCQLLADAEYWHCWQVAVFTDLMTQQEEFEVHCVFWEDNFTSGEGLQLKAVVDTIFDDQLKYTP